jgi:anti-repressor protein
LNKLALNEQPTMTSRQIADLVESRHDSVKRAIVRLVKAGAIGQPPLVDGERAANNVSEQVYLIGKRDSYVLVAQLSPQFTARLVDRWQELESKSSEYIDLNDPRTLRAALLAYSDRVITLEAKVTADAPKVAFAEIVRAIDGVCHIGDVGKMFRIGRTKFFKRLRDDGVLMSNNLPYQKYIDREYFTVIEQEPYTDSKGVKHPTFTAMVTGAGQVFLAKRYASIMEAV